MAESEELDSLRDDFSFLLEETHQELSHIIEEFIQNNLEHFNDFKGKLHTLKGAALAVQYKMCSDICHELETHIESTPKEKLSEQHEIDLIYSFLDLLPLSIEDDYQRQISKKLKHILDKIKPSVEVESTKSEQEPLDAQVLKDLGLEPPFTPLNQQSVELGHYKLVVDYQLDDKTRKPIVEILKNFNLPLVSLQSMDDLVNLQPKGLKPFLLISSQLESSLMQANDQETACIIVGQPGQQLNTSLEIPFSYLIHDDSLEREFTQYLFRVMRSGDIKRENTERKMLLADDNLINLKVAKKTFEKLGFNVDTVKNGEEVIEKASQNCYDFAVLDLEMPKFSGLEAALKLRNTGKQLPIFAYSAHERQEIKDTVLNLAMDDWLSKPVDKEYFKSLVETYQL